MQGLLGTIITSIAGLVFALATAYGLHLLGEPRAVWFFGLIWGYFGG